MEDTPRKTNTGLIVGIVLILAFIGGAILVSNQNNTNTTTRQEDIMQPTTSTESSDAMTEPTGTSDAIMQARTINLEAGSFYYKPSEIRVKKGEKVTLIMKSMDMMHDFNIDELQVKIPVTKAGSSATVEFTADTVGTFQYYCSVGQHRQNGQVGTLIVEE